ncbi:MAG TPA: asparagine synthase-related protein [Burkholderiales bacterium]|nr:asparagine synthase-related protein [Burkholderiales bacterium]
MSGICGWFDPDRRDAANGSVEAMAAVLARFDASPVRAASASWGAVAVAGRETDADLYQDHERLVLVQGRARWSDERFAEAGRRDGFARSIAQGYAENGAEVLKRLAGSFSLAILDRASRKALLATDRMGTRSLCYSADARKLVFGSTLDAISAHPGSGGRIRRQAIYDYVHFHIIPSPGTVYLDRYRLAPGTFLEWDSGNARAAPYWTAQFVEHEERAFPALKEEFLALVRKSVAEAAEAGSTGAFLSGGTDSSTVTGMLRQVTGEAPRSYSIGFDAEGFDEIGYARIAARRFDARHKEYYVTPEDVVRAIPRIAQAHDQPFGNSSAVPTYYCAKLAREDGVDTLLGGDGGDELFGGNARYATQYLYSLYSDLPQPLRRGVLEPVLAMLPEVGIVGKARRYMAHASLPMPARYELYNLLQRLGPKTVFTSGFLEAVSPAAPALQMEQAYRSTNADSLINRMLALDFKYTLADNDLPKVVRSSELAGVEVRFPFLHDEIVAFSARLAPDLKLRRARLRYFFKKALQDFLPPEIIRKSKHGFGLPFGRWLQTHQPLRELAFDSLADLRTRHIVSAQFIDRLTGVHVKSHADYYGTMVWILMMLEQWLRQHRVSV